MNRPFKTIRHLLLLLATAAAALCPGDSWADEISYLDYDGTLKTVDATKLTSGTTTIAAAYTLFTAWYYVSGNVTINGDLTVTGSADDFLYIILCDGASLTVTGKINCAASINIYAQSTGNEISGNNTGRLTVQSTADDAISCYSLKIYGGRITVSGGVTSVSFDSGQFLAGKITDIDMNYMYASDFVQVGTYDCNVNFGKKMMIGDDPTNSVDYQHNLAAGDDKSIINGKKLSPHPNNIFTVEIDPTITGGTITADRASAVGEHENVTLTLTPAAGFELTDASWSFGGNVEPISASDLATAQSTGKWIFSPYLYGLGGDDVTFSATFTPLAASITSGGATTYFATIASAFDAVPTGLSTPTIIDVLRDIDESATNNGFSWAKKNFIIDLNGKTAKLGSIYEKSGSLTIKDSSTGHTGKAEFVFIQNMGAITIDGANVSIENLFNEYPTDYKLQLDNGATLTTDRAMWWSTEVLLDHGSHWTAKNYLDIDEMSGIEFVINDRNSWVQLVGCRLDPDVNNRDHLKGLLTSLAPIGTTITVDGLTGNTVVLRKTWSLDLKNAFNEISAGVPSATVQYFDGGTTAPKPYNPDDDTSFRPANYPGANEITAINNSDGQDHYIIMHIVPHEGNPHDTDDPDYWTNERLLYVMEGASAASRSRGPGISLNLPYLLKADEYDADIDPAVTDMQPRHDGAGWYYYKLPASHCAANGYTKSTLQGLAAPVFDMETVSLAQDLETGVVTLSRTTDSWTAELTYDRLHWPFTGTIDDTDKPKLKKLVMKYGGTALITLDTTPASESASDVAKAAAAQAEITAQITHNYPFGQATLEWNQQQIGSATAFGWFKRYSDDSYFWIDVPFTPLDPTEATYPAGTANNPWLIQNGADLSMLAKCVNIGSWTAHNRYLRQSADIDLAAEGVTDFEPIASTGFLGLGFEGNYDGFGYTISHIDYTCTRLPDLDGTKCFVGLFGQVFGMDDRPGSVKNVTLKDCEFKAAAGSCAVAVGTIAGYLSGHSASAMTISNCKVLGSTEVSGLPANCGTGAIIGHCDFTTESNNSLANNYYGYNVSVTNDGGTATGYTPRGYSHGLVFDADADAWTYEWRDVTDSNGAMLGVKKATLPAANANGSTVAFSQTTTPALADATHPADCYKIIGTDYYYAVDQPVTLSVTTGSVSPDGVRTFYDELSTLTMNDGTADTDIKDALGFTMPGTDVTIEATFTPSDWFTIDTNQKEWMSFYHLWEDTAPANYTVTDLADNSITALTITDVDLKRGAITPGVLDGISYSGMPTLFYCKNGLPEKLKFTPNATASTNVTPWRYFSGVKEDTPMKGYTNVYVLNGIGDFYLADITDTDYTLKAHRCYIAIGNNAGVLHARLHISGGEETGIDSMFNVQYSMFNGQWFSLDGRKLDGKPTQKGIYINGGRKVVIK